MEETDAAAVARAQAGDKDGFRSLVERHSRSVFRLAYRLTGNEHDADDVVQETFLRAYKQLDHFESRASFGTWVYRIAANCSLDLIRSRKRQYAHRPLPARKTMPCWLSRRRPPDPTASLTAPRSRPRSRLPWLS